MRVTIAGLDGKELPDGFTIQELVIVHADQPPPGVAGRMRDEGSRNYKPAEKIDPGALFKAGTRLSILRNKDTEEWFEATVVGKTSAKGWVRVRFDDGIVKNLMYNFYGTCGKYPRLVEGRDYTFL